MRAIAGSVLGLLLLLSSAASGHGAPPDDGPLLQRVSPRHAAVPTQPAQAPHLVPPPPLEVSPLVYRRVFPDPSAASRPAQSTPPVQLMPAVAFSAMGRVEHLLEAVCHLEAAGLTEDAERIRQLARDEQRAQHERLLQRRLAEQKALQGEIDRLQRLTGREEQIAIQVTMVEVLTEKMRAAGLGSPACPKALWRAIECVRSGPDGATPFCSVVAEDKAALAGHLQELQRQGLLKVLAEQSLVTTSGRAGRVQSGGRFPVPTAEQAVEWQDFGVRLEAVPVVLGGGRLRLDLEKQVSERDIDQAVQVAARTVPPLSTKRVATRIEMEFGQTVVVGGMVSRHKAAGSDEEESRTLILLVTAEPVARENGTHGPVLPTPQAD